MTVLVPFAFPAGFGSTFSGLFLSLPLSESPVTFLHLTNDIITDKEYKDDQIENYKYQRDFQTPTQ
jgi:hypothetical protein